MYSRDGKVCLPITVVNQILWRCVYYSRVTTAQWGAVNDPPRMTMTVVGQCNYMYADTVEAWSWMHHGVPGSLYAKAAKQLQGDDLIVLCKSTRAAKNLGFKDIFKGFF